MNVVVVGAGLAAANAVESLREDGYTDDITVLGEEPHPPYERPPLSKAVLLGKDELESVFVHDRQWYADQQVDLRTGTRVDRIDLARRRVGAGDDEIAYDRLLIATGATPRRFPDLDPLGDLVTYLRTIEDSTALKPRLTGSVLVVGGGWIGLEVAAAAREAGADVTLVEPEPLPLHRVLGEELATVFADLHREHGVDLRLRTSVEDVERAGEGAVVRLSDGHSLTPDLVVVGIGVQPNVEVGADAGLAVDNGVLVDPRLGTDDPYVFAAGDVANHDHPVLGRRIRVEHWDTAIHQGRHAARTMLGAEEPYTRLPYFFTDQYDLGMEYVGSVGPEGYDEVVIEGDVPGRTLRAYYLSGGRVVAGLHLNDWDAIDEIREKVGQEAAPAPGG